MFDRERKETLGTKLEAEMTFVVPLPEKVVDDCWKELFGYFQLFFGVRFCIFRE